jgi:hypothetical protein
MHLTAIQKTDELMADPAVRRLFSQHLISSWRDLYRFVLAWLTTGTSQQELRQQAENVLDICAGSGELVGREFGDNFDTVRGIMQALAEEYPHEEFNRLTEEAYRRAIATRRQLMAEYMARRPMVQDLLSSFAADDGGLSLPELAEQVLLRCCNSMLDLLGARRIILLLRKSRAYDASKTTYSKSGRLLRTVAAVQRENEPPEPGTPEHERWRREQHFLASDFEGSVARGLFFAPEFAAAAEHRRAILWYANSDHLVTLHEHATDHYPPLYNLVSYLFSYLNYRRHIERQTLLSDTELKQANPDELYTGQEWLTYGGGYFDYDVRLVIPLLAGDDAIGFLAVDNFDRHLGDLELDTAARETVRKFELYRRRRKAAQQELIGSWLREQHPDTVNDILTAAPDAVKDPERFLAYRAMDFIDSRTKRRFFTYLESERGISFRPSEDELSHVLELFKSSRPVSRQAMRFAEYLAEDIADQIAAVGAIRIAESSAHREALAHVSKERSLTSRTLRHEGINRLTALRNIIADTESHLRQMKSAWGNFVELFGDFSEQHISRDLYYELGPILEPLNSSLGSINDMIKRVERGTKIGDELNLLFLRHKGGGFRKEYVLIHEVLDEVLERYNALYFEGPNITVRTNFSDRDLLVYCFKELMITVFSTYLDNACDALIRKKEGQREIEITTSVEGDEWHFRIADNGAGFWENEEVMQNPMLLYSNYSSKQGTEHGVGLKVVYEIITDISFHNGQLDVPESEPGRTVFGFRIPVTEDRVLKLGQRAGEPVVESEQDSSETDTGKSGAL